MIETEYWLYLATKLQGQIAEQAKAAEKKK